MEVNLIGQTQILGDDQPLWSGFWVVEPHFGILALTEPQLSLGRLCMEPLVGCSTILQGLWCLGFSMFSYSMCKIDFQICVLNHAIFCTCLMILDNYMMLDYDVRNPRVELTIYRTKCETINDGCTIYILKGFWLNLIHTLIGFFASNSMRFYMLVLWDCASRYRSTQHNDWWSDFQI